MKFSLNSTYAIVLATVSSAFLAACGAGQSASASAPLGASAAPVTVIGANAPPVETSTNALPVDASTNAAPPVATAGILFTGLPTLLSPSQPVTTPVGAADLITDIRFESTAAAGTATQAAVPVTFGHVFAPGAVLATNGLIGQLKDGTTLPLQMDIKATHPDGSVRHAVVSAVLPNLAPGESRVVTIARKTASSLLATAATASLLNAGFTSKVNLALNGQLYSASADDLLKTTPYKTWLAGATASEWIVSAPLKTAEGAAHPHLTARFAIRWYSAVKKARVDVTVENAWAYEAAPQDFTYDAQVLVGGKSVFEKAAMPHYHHARWRKVFWWGDAPQVHIRHNTNYLISTRAVPNYDQSVVIPEASLAALSAEWTGPRTEPMGVGMAVPYMPTTGGRRDLGLLPSWSAMYLLSMDKRAKDAMLGTADLAGSWSSHYRNKVTDRPVSLKEFPYMTILGNAGDTLNPATKQYEKFPVCASGATCSNPSTHDTSHQPAFAYLPYLVTGDYYYLEELQFWSMWNVLSYNPYYRSYGKALVILDQVRGQAWSLRTLAEAAYITPDADPLKSHFNEFLSSNLDWFNDNYTNNINANKLGALVNGYNMNHETRVQPWMDDFFTSAVGHAAEMGFSKAKTLLQYKARFSIGRMTDANACWIDASIYYFKFRDTETSPTYTSMGQAYAANHTPAFAALPCAGVEMAASLSLKVGEMTGYSATTVGSPSNLQPALAYSVDAGIPNGAAAWQVFMSRSIKPNYGTSPQFAIVPR